MVARQATTPVARMAGETMHHVEIAGYRLHVEIHGVTDEVGAARGSTSASRAPVVLLHEGLGSVAGWGSFPGSLAAATARPVIVYDRRGYGRSDPYPGPWPTTFLVDEARDQLGPLVTALADRPPILVGHSDGASIALAHPAHRGSHLAALGIVSIAAHVIIEEVSIAAVRALRANPTKLLDNLAAQHPDPRSVLDNWGRAWESPDMQDWTLDHELTSIDCPVLAIQGSRDRFGSAAQLEHIASRVSAPVETVELPGIDHWPHRECTEALLTLIRGFCDRVDPDETPATAVEEGDGHEGSAAPPHHRGT